jgi:excisionase family DNA binding protein
MSPLLTRREAAEFLRISERHIDRMARAGRLVPFRIGRNVRFRRHEVEALGGL